MNRRKDSFGFTLMDLLVVLAIIGLVAAILLPKLADALNGNHAGEGRAGFQPAPS